MEKTAHTYVSIDLCVKNWNGNTKSADDAVGY